MSVGPSAVRTSCVHIHPLANEVREASESQKEHPRPQGSLPVLWFRSVLSEILGSPFPGECPEHHNYSGRLTTQLPVMFPHPGLGEQPAADQVRHCLLPHHCWLDVWGGVTCPRDHPFGISLSPVPAGLGCSLLVHRLFFRQPSLTVPTAPVLGAEFSSGTKWEFMFQAQGSDSH